MSIKGSAESYIELRGSLDKPDAIRGRDAYEEAVAEGFNGTRAEWLASLKGPAPVKGVDYFTPEEVQDVIDTVLRRVMPSKLGYVTLYADKWRGEISPFSQVVEVEGATEHSQVDLTPSVEQLSIFHQKDLAFVTENEDGVVTVFAVGQKPENDYTIQVTITEVEI
jgi:hypothetical protein